MPTFKTEALRLVSNVPNASSVAPIIGSAIGNTLYRQVFLYRLSDRYVWQITSRSVGSASLLVMTFLGGQVVARKPYLIQTLRLTLVL